MEATMFKSFVWRGVISLVLLAVLVAGAAGVGVLAYNAGVARGLADSGKVVVPPAGVVPYPYLGFFGPGFGLLNCLLLFFVFGLFFMVVRGLLWGGLFGMWRRPFWHRAWGGPDAPHDWRRAWEKGYPPMFDEWHRRAHGQTEPTPPESNQV
jgi:hypothetical protein